MLTKEQKSGKTFQHITKLIDSVDAGNMFDKDFDFNYYYASFQEMEEEAVVALGREKYDYFI